MARDAHPVLMLEAWVKAAKDYQRPAGMSEALKRQPSVGKEKPQYARPAPPAAVTRPDTIASQKALSPPPVM